MYLSGLAVYPPDYLRAYIWLSLAKAQGDETAAEGLETVIWAMTPADISKVYIP